MATAVPTRAGTVPRIAVWDGVFIGLSIVHAGLLLVAASIPVIALALWWNANTISHNFIHRPFFRSHSANRAYSVFLSLVLGIPQSLWRARHLAHHGETRGGLYVARTEFWSAAVVFESIVVVALWSILLAMAPAFALTVYLPGYLLGLGLCFLQGHFEHARGTTSHYGRIYNALFFNDGYHVEHHERPGVHWTQLPAFADVSGARSRWPPVLRWLDALSLESLERLVLRSTRLQRFVLSRHEQAFRRLLPSLGDVRRVTIVGGGLFPRTALILERLLPGAALVIVDGNAENLATARRFLAERVEYRCEWYDPAAETDAVDLVVIPLAFAGDRARVYARPPAPAVLVHDWITARHTAGVVVSWLLLKRLNLLKLGQRSAC
jgi:hypothetical protein